MWNMPKNRFFDIFCIFVHVPHVRLLYCCECFSDITKNPKIMKIAFFELCSKKRANFVPLASKPDEYVLRSLPAKIGKFSSKIDLFEFFFKIHIYVLQAPP